MALAQELRSFPFLEPSRGVADAMPELRDADYQSEVFQLSADNYEAYLTGLIMKAASLGISLSRSPSTNSMPDHDNIVDAESGAESNATFDTIRTRTVSTGSHESASTALTSHSSNHSRNHTGRILPRKRSRSSRGLTFVQYESYLIHFKPNLGQPKFVAAPPTESAQSIISVSTRKSCKIIRERVLRLRSRKGTTALSEPSIMCRAQFCYICGAVWDPSVGCPNFCNGDEEMERRRQEEEARIAALEAEEAKKQEAAAKEAAEEREAEERTRNCNEFKVLRARQAKEMERFRIFERDSRWLLWTRHLQQKNALVEKHGTARDKVLERHAKTSANLEDRQVAAEMELRGTLEQRERHVRVRLKHMEAYCDGLGHNPNSGMPSRVVTERDLRELGQQYNLEKNMKQLHQAKINVLRDRQAKALEELLERQKCELDRLTEKNVRELEHLELDLADEEDALTMTFSARQSTLEMRWRWEMEIMRKELENERGVRYNLIPPLEWPHDKAVSEDGLAAVE
ncbi:hypothetical protein O1611_g4736 [Lasiodiplodia mahajangana]|uniref:Uncharacterized protein n=1 Tax=Lasiodiplodia mahajangana TaxID=1108764 RepID=A0ACC2JNB6_9PEZI|nr:hypothetical protein O1611_g4736 [Lasiodiplodia mahajangana]